MRDLPRVSRYLHVPAQSGCDEMLKRMKRLYTVAEYDEMMARIARPCRQRRSPATSSSASAARRRQSFERSVALVERSRFKNSFIFKYSPRTGTKADSLYADDVSRGRQEATEQ